MKAGFTSVMYDGSSLALEKNIANTKIVVKVAKALEISVEAEVGRVGKSEEGEDVGEILTDPKIALKFAEETGIDALAVAVGTVHGMQKQSANLHMDLCEELSRLVPAPLVLHGSSGVKNEDLIKLSKTNFCKINIGTRLKIVYTEKIREILKEDPALKSPLTLMKEASSAITETVKEKISFLGSANKA
jgi:ketose-bisphosphate aldolase